jgi:excisionase family DNA binding protein
MKEANTEFVTTSEAATLLGVALRTIQLWVENGSLSAWKTLGGHRRISKASVEKILADREAALKGLPRKSPLTAILIVEPDVKAQRIYKNALTVGAKDLPKVTIVATGFEALQKAIVLKPELIFMPLNLPHMHGPALAQALLDTPGLSPQIIVIADSKEALTPGARLPKGCRVLLKPLREAKIQATVHECLARTVPTQ